MAGVFLLLLYASPAALVLYWTMNNVFSVGKSLIFLRLFPHEKYVPDPEDKTFKDYVQGLKDAVKPCLTPDFYAFVVAIVLFGLQCRFLNVQYLGYVKLFLLIEVLTVVTALAALWGWFRRFRRKEENWYTLAKIFVAGLLFVVSFAIILYCRLHGAHAEAVKKLVFFGVIFAVILIYTCLSIILSWRMKHEKIAVPSKNMKSLYWWNILFLCVSITILWPVLVFLSSPADAETTVWTVFGSNLPILVVLLALAFVCFRLVEKEKCSKLAVLVLFLSILVVLYHYILPCNYGELDKAMLGMDEKLKNESIFPWLGDIAVLISVMLLAKICVRRYPVQSRNVVAVIFICLIGLTVIRMVKYIGSDDAKIVNAPAVAELPKNNDALNGYSKDGKNIVLFITDQFCGGYMENILKDHPEYKKDYSGFTWYKNAIALGNYTCGSIPSLFAGEDYSPERLNKMKGNGYDKIRESSKVMVDAFTSDNYKVSILGGGSSYMSPSWYKGINYTEKTPYANYYQQNYMGSDSAASMSPGPLFIMLSIFQNSPYFLKPIIYNDAGWLIFSEKAQFRTVEGVIKYEYGFMKLLPQVSNANEKGNTFKFIHSTLTHRPWCFKKDGTVVNPGEFSDEAAKSFWTGDAAYYTCSGFMPLFIDYINWLKANGVYDNTYIILISDHGNDYPEHNPFTDEHDFNRLNALFMIKPFGSSGDLKTDSNTFISLQDIPAFLKNAKDGTPVVIPKDRKVNPVYFIHLQTFLDTGNLEIIRSFEVSDNIFDEKNWKEIK